MRNRNEHHERIDYPGAHRFGWTLILFFFLIFGLPACYESVEGCLDTNALNFSLDADRECEGCCTYPSLSVRLVHQWVDADTSFTLRYTSDAFQDGSGNPFAINRITYYLKDFVLRDDSGADVPTNDTILVALLNNNGIYEPTIIPDDYLLINASVSSQLEVGTLQRNGNFTQLRFALGIDEITDRILPTSLSNNHPLSLLDSTMYDLINARYHSNRLSLNRDTTPIAESILLTYGSETAAVPITVNIPGGFPLPAGFNIVITLQVNYAEWFRSVNNITTASEETLIPQIVAGLPNAFTLLDITVNQQ